MAGGCRNQARSCLSPVKDAGTDRQSIEYRADQACRFDLPAYGHHGSSGSRQLTYPKLPNAWMRASGVERTLEPCSRSEGFPKLASLPDENSTVDAILAKSPPFALEIPENISFEHWLAVGKHLALTDNALAWRIGDWWTYGEHRHGDRIAVLRTKAWSGPSFGACRNYATVARAFETSRRRDALSFGHHREVASLSPEDADRLLDWAEQPLCSGGRPRSTRELRDQVRCRNAGRRRPLSGSRTRLADIADAIARSSQQARTRGVTRRPTVPLPAGARLDDSSNILPVPAELASLRVAPPPDLDRVAIARAALDALDGNQLIDLFLERPHEVRVAHVRLTLLEVSTHRTPS
jgi:hypothetical protein